MLGVDRHKHLDDVIFRQTIEDDRGYREVLVLDVVDVRMEREQAMLAVDCTQDSFALGHLEAANRRTVHRRFECKLLVTRDDHGARDGRKISRLSTLLVVLHEFVDLSPDDLTLIGLLARRDPALEQVPIHLRGRLLVAATDRLPGLPVVEHFEAH